MISVIIPTYNRAHLIGETLDSIIAQTYSDWECIIIDDHSTDNTDEVIDEYLKNDKRFSYFKKHNHLPKGPSASRNFGLTKARGDYINWFDSDDLMHPKKMEIDLNFINSGDYDFTISQSKFFTDDGSLPKKEIWNQNLWSEDPINDFILKKIGWSVNSSLWSTKAILDKDLKFNDEQMTADDFLYHLEAISKQFKPCVIKEKLVLIREHSNRLNNYKNKSPSKLNAFLKIINSKEVFDLNQRTENKLYELVLRQFSNLLKKKDIKTAGAYKKQIKEALPNSYSNEISRLYKYGILHKFTGRCYTRLSVKINHE
jgi:glycosyltransferase involved in cell wall biosynthesis